MPTTPKQTFDVGSFLSDQGIQLAGVDEKGGYRVRTPEGEEKTLDVHGMLKGMGVDSRKYDLEFNTPDAPLDVSPVGLKDRALLAGTGNTKGHVAYLKNKFEDARFSEDNGLLVRNKGVWQKVDPSGMDPWEMSKDVVEGVVGLVPSMVGSGLAGAKGFAMGLPAGPVAAVAGGMIGAGAGGAAAGLTTRAVLGRLAGTYKQDDPVEELKEVALDFGLNALGQGIAVGTKPTLQAIAPHLKKLGLFAAKDTAVNASVDIMSEALGRTTGMGPVNMRTIIDQTDDVVKALGKAKEGAMSESDIVLHLQGDQLRHTEALLAKAPQALSRKFGELKQKLVGSIDDSFEASVGDIVKQSQNDLVEMGLGKWVAPSGGKSAPKFALLSPEDIKRITMTGEGQAPAQLSEPTRKALGELTDIFNEYAGYGTLKGKKAAAVLMDVKKNVNETLRELTGGQGVTPTTKHFVEEFRGKFATRLGQSFDKAGATDNYLATSNLYEKYADTVSAARRMADEENGVEGLLNKLVKGIGANRTYKDMAGQMAELMGDEGQAHFKNITVKEAAKAAAQKFPKVTLGSLNVGNIAGATLGAGVVTGGVAPVTAGLAVVGGAAVASPRAVLREVQYAKKGLEFIKSLPENQKLQWLRNPNLVRETFKAIGGAAIGEEQETENLLKASGVYGE